MICWSCEKSAGPGPFCAACGAILPPDPAADHFRVLGVAPAYAVDLVVLEQRYKEAARKMHPDKFARADQRARRASMAHSVRLNDAWKTLRDPVKRAEYLLTLAGIEVGSEEGTVKTTGNGGNGATAGEGSGRVRVPVPQELLMEILELREALMDARAEGDEATVRKLADDVGQRRAEAMNKVAAAFVATPANVDAAAHELVSVRYFDRFLAEVAHGEREPVGAEVGHAR
ncbi:MAG TPA: Fe-S protein assembly co-chaperone HscB [Polyangia bacterium]